MNQNQFLKDLNIYAQLISKYSLANMNEDTDFANKSDIELSFSVYGGNDFKTAKKWYEWIKYKLFSSTVKDDLMANFKVDACGLRCTCQRMQIGKWYCDPLNYRINWYYDNGKKIHRSDIREFITNCGLNWSDFPDFREDMLDY